MSIRFRSYCPSCPNMDFITWHHKDCPSGYKEFIDIKGYITCECGKRFHILDGYYNCGSSDHNNKYDPITNRIRLTRIFGMTAKIDRVGDKWIDEMQENIYKEWERRH